MYKTALFTCLFLYTAFVNAELDQYEMQVCNAYQSKEEKWKCIEEFENQNKKDSPTLARPTRSKSVQELIDEYGKNRVIDLLKLRGDKQFTYLAGDGSYKRRTGMPERFLMNAQTIQIDLERAGLPPVDFEWSIIKSIQEEETARAAADIKREYAKMQASSVNGKDKTKTNASDLHGREGEQ